MATLGLSYCAGEVRAHDHDRFLTALFAPSKYREGLFALYAFNIEVAKVRETVSESMLGQVRLQWWREAIDDAFRGIPRPHAVIQALAPAITERDLSRHHFDRLIDAREADLHDLQPKTMAKLEDYAEATSSTLGWLALEVLGAKSEAARLAVGHVGMAWSLTGLIRALPQHLRMKRVFLPLDLLARHGIDSDRLVARPDATELRDVVAEIADTALVHLATARALRPRLETTAVSVLLPAVIARRYLRRLARAGHNPYSKRLSGPPALLPLTLTVSAALRRY